MIIYIVYCDSGVENECGCYSDEVDSIWSKESDANQRAKEVYKGFVVKQQVR